ncbi:MAG: sigma-70 family polymerase sigma factor [Conexibacter sp.]|nr:sigma-70 family polymerase sigma factor [Conexibacter sp.]
MALVESPPPALPPSMLAAMADDTLVGLVAAGSDDAFAALDARYRRRLVRFATGFVPGGTADAEDVVQEAMVRAVRALRKGSRPEAVGAWLHRITRNCALDLTAARRRHPVVELADHAHPVAEDAQATVERRMGVRGLVADVGALPDTQRSALVLRELEGRSYADIADELDVTVPAVKSLLVRARQGLKSARDGRRVAGWLPLPLLGRLVERATSVWEPVAAGATPKVACAAAVVAGSLPMIAGPATTTPPPAPVPSQTAQVRSAAPSTPRQTGGPGTPAQAVGAVARRAASLAATATTVALHEDCADGKIDGAYSKTALFQALGHAGQGAEYGDCRQALMQASWRLPARG